MNTRSRSSFFSRLFLAAVAATLILSNERPATAQYVFYPNNATINSALSADTAIVGYPNYADWMAASHGSSPTIKVAAGAKLGGLQTYNSSVANMSGGVISGAGIIADMTSKVNITGGTVSEAFTWDKGTINVYVGANIPGAVWAQEGGTVNVYGGTIGSKSNDAFAQGTGNALNIDGGAFVSKQIFVDGGAGLLISGNPSHLVQIGTYEWLFIPAHTVTSTLVSSYAFLTYHGNTTGGWSEYKLSGQLSDGTDVTGMMVYVANDGITSFTVDY